MTNTVIDLKNISKSFVRGTPVLKSINLQIEDGEFVGLIGASGSGKSTLIRIISGLETTDGSGSSVKLHGQTMQQGGKRSRSQRAARKDLGVIFQQFNLVTRLSLLKNVLVGRLGRVASWRGMLGIFSQTDKIRALQNLERVGMIDFTHQRASQLSGGQQQRGAIARVLTQQAKTILADEPIASLDPASAENVMEILGDINREDGTTIIVSLHQIGHALKHCKRVVALKDGAIVFDGPASTITADDLSALYGIELDEAAHQTTKKSNSTTAFPAQNNRKAQNQEAA